MKKLTVITPEILPVPPVKGGAVERSAQEIYPRLAQKNEFDITLISRPSGQEMNNGVHYIGIPWTKLEKAFFWLKQRVSWRNPLRYVAKIQNVSSYARRVAKLTGDADITIVHNEPNILLFLKKRSGQRLILQMHNDHLTHKAFRWLYNMALSKVDQVIYVSEYLKKNASQYFPKHAHKFCVLLNSTDADLFHPYPDAKHQLSNFLQFDAGTKYILYVGRIVPDKGVHVLIEAFKKILLQVPNTKLVIAGSSFFEGAVKTDYQKEIASLAKPINDAIIFTGYIPHEKLKYLYAAVDVIAFPSLWQEPFGLVVIEAMASGTSLVASKVGGIPEIIDPNVDGILVEAGDQVMLAEKIIFLLSNPDLKKKMEQKARNKVLSKFTHDHKVTNFSRKLTV